MRVRITISKETTGRPAESMTRRLILTVGYDVTYRDVGGGHDFVHWGSILADGLLTLLKR